MNGGGRGHKKEGEEGRAIFYLWPKTASARHTQPLSFWGRGSRVRPQGLPSEGPFVSRGKKGGRLRGRTVDQQAGEYNSDRRGLAKKQGRC